MTTERTDPRSVLDYDPATGAFTWKVDMGKKLSTRRGMPAGGLNLDGYVEIRFRGQRYYGHRLAFLFMTGRMPTQQVDHIDIDKSNNRWANLREVPAFVNNENRVRARSDSRSGVIGVELTPAGRYQARIRVQGERKSLGTFGSADAAHAAYVAAKRRLHAGCTL